MINKFIIVTGKTYKAQVDKQFIVNGSPVILVIFLLKMNFDITILFPFQFNWFNVIKIGYIALNIRSKS